MHQWFGVHDNRRPEWDLRRLRQLRNVLDEHHGCRHALHKRVRRRERREPLRVRRWVMPARQLHGQRSLHEHGLAHLRLRDAQPLRRLHERLAMPIG